jgi:hypothetical protein
MATAQAKVGIKSPSVRLAEIAEAVVGDGSAERIDMRDAFYRRLAAEKDVALYIALIEPKRSELFLPLMAKRLDEIRNSGAHTAKRNRDASEGHNSDAHKGHDWVAPSHPEPDQHAERGHSSCGGDAHRSVASPRAEPDPGASSGNGQSSRDTREVVAVANFRPARQPLGAQVILGSLRREIIVAGGVRKPLAIATAAEARLYSKLIGFRSAWIERLVTGLVDDAVIGEHRADADVERAMTESRKVLAHV